MPGWSVKNLSAVAIGSRPSSFLLMRLDLGARGKRLGHLALRVTLLDHVARKQPHQLALAVHHGKRAEGKPLLLNQAQHVPDQLVGRRLDRLLDKTVHVILHAADFRKLLPLRHVVVDQPQSPVERHRNGHARLRHRIHVRGDDRDVQRQPLSQHCVELCLARQDLRVKRRQRHVVERQPDVAVGREESIRRFVEL